MGFICAFVEQVSVVDKCFEKNVGWEIGEHT